MEKNVRILHEFQMLRELMMFLSDELNILIACVNKKMLRITKILLLEWLVFFTQNFVEVLGLLLATLQTPSSN